MKIISRLVLCVAVLGLLLTVGCARNQAPWPGVGVHKDLDDFTVKVGQEFAIEVNTRPRLDLKWTEQYDHERLALVDSREVTGRDAMLGGYAKMFFLFKAVEAGQTQVVLTYEGPPPAPPAQTVVFTMNTE